jgi:trafficking protein particle complex subunit 11
VDGRETQDPENGAAFGITQKWHLRANFASFAEEPLNVKSIAMKPEAVHGAATCEIIEQIDGMELTINPQDHNERSFIFDSRKLNLEERRPTNIDAVLDITWQRASSPSNPTVTSSVPIPRISFNTAEPRVLATTSPSALVSSCIHLDYVLENPTMHFLTFELTMEASEEFGFSGAKLRNLRLLPMSRQTVRYNLLPQARAVWITPNLRVVDKYFNQVLKVMATDGLRTEKGGVGIWVPEEEEDE